MGIYFFFLAVLAICFVTRKSKKKLTYNLGYKKATHPDQSVQRKNEIENVVSKKNIDNQ